MDDQSLMPAMDIGMTCSQLMVAKMHFLVLMCLSFCLSNCGNLRTTEWIFMKPDTLTY